MNRAFDLIAVVCVAVVVLLPKASVDARPALQADKVDSNDLTRIAELEESLARNPANETVAVELAHFYLRAERPDWALITLSPFDPATASARTWLLRATAHAERLEPALAVAASKSGQLVCKNHGCASDVGARLQVIAAPMQALLDDNIDPRTDPQRAKEAVGKALHATKPGTGFGAVSSDKK
jgi:hypothetical protein